MLIRVTLSLFTFVSLSALSCSSPTKSDFGNAFLGTWQSDDSLQVKIEINRLIREGREIEQRFDLKLADGFDKNALPKNYINEGQYNFKLSLSDKKREKLQRELDHNTEGLPRFRVHPFEEFLYKNSLRDTITFLGYQGKDEFKRRYRGLPDVTFKRIE